MSDNIGSFPSPKDVPTVYASTHSGGAHRGRMFQLSQMHLGGSSSVQMTVDQTRAAVAAMTD